MVRIRQDLEALDKGDLKTWRVIRHHLTSNYYHYYWSLLYGASSALMQTDGCPVWSVKTWNCHRKLMPFWCTFCVHHTTMHQFTVSLFLTPHLYDVYVFNFNLPPALSAEWPGHFMCYCGNMGPEWVLKWVDRTWATFRSWVWHSNHWTIHTPKWHDQTVCSTLSRQSFLAKSKRPIQSKVQSTA